MLNVQHMPRSEGKVLHKPTSYPIIRAILFNKHSLEDGSAVDPLSLPVAALDHGGLARRGGGDALHVEAGQLGVPHYLEQVLVHLKEV